VTDRPALQGDRNRQEAERDICAVVDPPVEGMLVRGGRGVDVGDEIDVELLSTNPKKGFIDFGRMGDTPTRIRRENDDNE